MAGKLDKSLDEILGARAANRPRRSARSAAGKASANGAAKTAPVGGVQKASRNRRSGAGAAGGATTVTAATAAPQAVGESKILVTGLPADVDEANIKEYFHKSAGPVKRVLLNYNQNGTSRGIASISFVRPDTAAKAAKELNGLLIDKRPIRIEVIVDAARAPAPPEPKSLAERVAQPPKPANAATPKSATAKTAGRGRRNRRSSTRARPKKTKEDLDAEMDDYYAAAPNGEAAQQALTPAQGSEQAQQPANGANGNNGGDVGMEEI